MSRKNKNRPKSVLKSLKDLGSESRDTLSQFATTVRVEGPARALGMGPAAKAGQVSYQSPLRLKADGPEPPMSRLARRLFPFRRPQPARDQGAQTAHKLQKLAKQMAKGKSTMSKKTRSRLPVVILLVVALVASGTYAVWNALPSFKLGEQLSYKKWLDTASGQVRSSESKPAASQAQASAPRSSASQRSASVKSRPGVAKPTQRAAVAKKKSSGKRSGKASLARHKKGGKKSKMASKPRLSKGKQKQQLANLKQKSQKKYRQVSTSSRPHGKAVRERH